MFTGIVEEVGVVTAIDVRPRVRGSRCARRGWRRWPRVGDSIALRLLPHGGRRGGRRDALRRRARDAARCTTLGEPAAGPRVNLEDAVRAGEPFGGHLVQGHVDGVGGVVAALAAEGDGEPAARSAPLGLLRYLVAEGLDRRSPASSLTVAELHDDGFASR